MENRVLTAAPRDARAGYSMVEVLIALVILAIGLVSAQALMADRLLVDTGTKDREAVASQLARDRVDMIQMDPVYATIQTRYTGTEDSIAGFPRFRRVTTFTHTSTAVPSHGVIDYQKVTVTVSHPNLRTPVSVSSTVGAP